MRCDDSGRPPSRPVRHDRASKARSLSRAARPPNGRGCLAPRLKTRFRGAGFRAKKCRRSLTLCSPLLSDSTNPTSSFVNVSLLNHFPAQRITQVQSISEQWTVVQLKCSPFSRIVLTLECINNDVGHYDSSVQVLFSGRVGHVRSCTGPSTTWSGIWFLCVRSCNKKERRELKTREVPDFNEITTAISNYFSQLLH